MNNTAALRIAAILGFIAVALGAFGAHGLKDVLTRNDTAAIWEKAVFYHFVHTVILFILATQQPVLAGPWLSFLLGILLFSGSLYVYAILKIHWLVFVTPLGGVGFLIGWAWLMICASKMMR